ncbi:DUF3343 domain-containing protein [Clostridium pasteurianum]|uniref:Putative Se/S carrier protein-like domain-containing protein n=1 Tax=Clostridium pasteurianum BC1 TaxID=86416 RepID=R4K864_CLOPA|nr:DUF3343 domain-containing protein [Clostridium pasteurianum]AGK97886.1 Protein of unknown function (DUF3343) [Clostridium pasteurianum BC1]
MEVCDDKYIMVIASNSQATYLYNELMKKGINVEFISTPAKISSGCSKSIIFNSKDTKEIVLEVKNIKIKIDGIYNMVKNDKDYNYIKI